MEEKMDISQVLVNNRIKFKEWRRMTNKQRDYVLESIFDERYTFEILSDIAPELRISTDFPDNYKNIQSIYMSQNQLQPRTRESIDTLRSALHTEIATMTDAMTKLFRENLSLGKQEKKHVGYEGYEGYSMLLEEPYYECDTYQIFEDFNYKDTIRRFCIQPFEETPEGYYNVLHDILYNNEQFTDTRIDCVTNVVFHVVNPDTLNTNYYTFSSNMGISEMFHEFRELLVEETEGSDKYMEIRKNISRISINVMSMPSGGTDTNAKPLPFFQLRKIRVYSNLENICFYQCIRKMLNNKEKKQCVMKYSAMRSMMYPDRMTFDTFEVPLSDLHIASTNFRVNFIVFENIEPEVIMVDDSIKYKSYKDIHRKYIIRWKIYYPYIGYIDSSDMTTACTTENNVSYIILNGIKYYMMIYHNNHYELIHTLSNPIVCNKCGSLKHTQESASKSDVIKLECLENISDFLDSESIKLELPPYVIIIFDFETHVKNFRQQTHFVAYNVFSPDGKLIEQSHIEGYMCERLFIQTIDRKYKQLKFLVGFNSSAFDNYFICKAMIHVLNAEFGSKNSIIYKNRMLRLSQKNIITWDLYMFVKCSLSMACEAYGINMAKGYMDYKRVNDIFEQYNYTNEVFDSPEYLNLKVAEYCYNDINMTSELYFIITRELYEVTKINPLIKPTLSSLVYTFFDIRFKKIPLIYDDIFSSVLGGRTQVIQKGYFPDETYCLLDINASYPSIGIDYKFGTGNITESCTIDNPDCFYNAICDVDQSNLKLKLCGYRKDKYSELDWSQDIVNNILLQPEEIEELEKHGCSVVRKKYLIWDNAEYILRDKQLFIKELRYKAKSEGNKVKENIYKLIANNISGKLMEKNHDEVWRIVRSQQDIIKFAEKYKDETTFDILGYNRFLMKGTAEPKKHMSKPRHMGARILALGRLKWWKEAIKYPSLKYGDTDSIIVALSEVNLKTLDDKVYGMWKLDGKTDELRVVASKSYWINENKNSLKSYRDGDSWKAVKSNITICSGFHKSRELYDMLLDKNSVVSTTYNKITKKFVLRENKNNYELAVLITEETTKLLT